MKPELILDLITKYQTLNDDLTILRARANEVGEKIVELTEDDVAYGDYKTLRRVREDSRLTIKNLKKEITDSKILNRIVPLFKVYLNNYRDFKIGKKTIFSLRIKEEA